MGLPRDMQHVSCKELFTSLPARIQYLQSFLEFTSEDVEALRMGQKYIKTVIPAVVNIVYKKLLRYDITARAFTTRDTRNEETIDEYVSEDSEQIKHRKMFLRWYLTKLNSDPSKIEYWEYLDKVGLMHVGLGRRNPLHIDYVFLGACLGFIQDCLFEAILSHPRLDISDKMAIVKALGKVIWMQNDLLAKWHCTDGQEYEARDSESKQLNPEGEKEGYVHGVKILGDNETTNSDGNDSDGASTVVPSSTIGRIREEVQLQQLQETAANSDAFTSRCPFSGMSTMMDAQRAPTSRPHRAKPSTESSSNNTTTTPPRSQPASPKPIPSRPHRLHPSSRSQSSEAVTAATFAMDHSSSTAKQSPPLQPHPQHQPQDHRRPPSPPPKSPRHQSPPKTPDALTEPASKAIEEEKEIEKKKEKRRSEPSMIPRLHIQNGKTMGKEQLVGLGNGAEGVFVKD